jgi:hypothetical protein
MTGRQHFGGLNYFLNIRKNFGAMLSHIAPKAFFQESHMVSTWCLLEVPVSHGSADS